LALFGELGEDRLDVLVEAERQHLVRLVQGAEGDVV
jgi:hypothetical protein